jgi:hypothetical protein
VNEITIVQSIAPAKDLKADPQEARNVAAAHSEVVEKIEAYLRRARTESARWPVK